MPAGTRITWKKLADYARYLTPATRWILATRGSIGSIDIGAYRSRSLPPPLVDATRRYACNVALDNKDTSKDRLAGFVAGLPFPRLQAGDPQLAQKLMWNRNLAGAFDDIKIKTIVCRTGQVAPPGSSEPPSLEKTFVLDTFRQFRFAGRLMRAPRPMFTENEDRLRERTEAHPLIEPFDLKGAKLTSLIYLNPRRMPDTVLYLPRLRRVRRLTAEQRSDALLGQDIDRDSFGGYGGPVELIDWKYLGERTVLVPFELTKTPVDWRTGRGGFLPKAPWQIRRVAVVEGPSPFPLYAYSRRVVYLDLETYQIVYSEIYDQAGQLWKLLFNGYYFSNRPFPADSCKDDWEFPYLATETVVDVQLMHATWCSIGNDPVRGGDWRVNKGEGYSEFIPSTIIWSR